MAEIIDTSGEEVVPYLIHLSKMGIVPKILGVEGGFAMKMVRAEGPRLSEALDSFCISELQKIYTILGKNIAYIGKLGVMHNDLHVSNIIVENRLPVIIDWDKASMMPLEGDLTFFAKDTESDLFIMKKEVLFPPLEKVLKENYYAEKSVLLDISHAEIQERAYKEFGII